MDDGNTFFGFPEQRAGRDFHLEDWKDYGSGRDAVLSEHNKLTEGGRCLSSWRPGSCAHSTFPGRPFITFGPRPKIQRGAGMDMAKTLRARGASQVILPRWSIQRVGGGREGKASIATAKRAKIWALAVIWDRGGYPVNAALSSSGGINKVLFGSGVAELSKGRGASGQRSGPGFQRPVNLWPRRAPPNRLRPSRDIRVERRDGVHDSPRPRRTRSRPARESCHRRHRRVVAEAKPLLWADMTPARVNAGNRFESKRHGFPRYKVSTARPSRRNLAGDAAVGGGRKRRRR